MKAVSRRISMSKRYQSGMVTTFTGILILVLLTLMMFFAMRVGVFEQRVSSSEMRQKLAFHAAESGIHHAKEFIRANSLLVTAQTPDFLPDGTHGWLSDEGRRWRACVDAPDVSIQPGDDPIVQPIDHPCLTEVGVDPDGLRRANLFYYTNDPTATSESPDTWRLPVDTGAVLSATNEAVDVFALLCVLVIDEDEIAETPVIGCTSEPDLEEVPGDGVIKDGGHFMVTLLARGQSDCASADGPCGGEALISEQVSNFGAAAGGRSPKVPLTTKSSFPPSGSAEVVPNPNAGGVGVPVSVWMNANTSCSVDSSVVDPSSGSWATCEYHEWYGTDVMPDDYACPGNCSCSEAESISYTKSTTDVLGIDLVADPLFPCDLFQFYFGVPRDDYEIVKGYSKIIDSCDGLGPNSFGIYWVTGPQCLINSNTQVGSPQAPVMLISAATETRFNGGAKIYGTVFVTDVENINAELISLGTNTVYGSVIVDGILGDYNGTFQVVWNDNTSRKAGNNGGIGSVIGGWSDMHREWDFAQEAGL